jgi:hypothetical protein
MARKRPVIGGPAAPPDKRFQPVGPRSRQRYIDTATGEELSKRQRDKRAREAGAVKPEPARQTEAKKSGVSQYWSEARAFQEKHNRLKKNQSNQLNLRDVKNDPQFRLQRWLETADAKYKPAPFAETYADDARGLKRARENYKKTVKTIVGAGRYRRPSYTPRSGPPTAARPTAARHAPPRSGGAGRTRRGK